MAVRQAQLQSRARAAFRFSRSACSSRLFNGTVAHGRVCLSLPGATSLAQKASYSTAGREEEGDGDLIDELDARGLIQTVTSRSLRTHLASAPRTVYSGVDPSARSLHVGNLLPLLTLAHFARHNHRAIVLVGGATGSIGDPSGRSTERNALDKPTLETNVNAITQQLSQFFANVQEYYHQQQPLTTEHSSTTNNFDAHVETTGLGMGVRLINNYQWMSSLSLLEFLGKVGRHARLTQMLARDSVASRLHPSASPSSTVATTSNGSGSAGGGMSYTEFSYQLLQAYDFYYLHRHMQCTVQIGGSDQLGNISAGIDLIRRTSGGLDHATTPAYGLTLPLLTTSRGEKFGKSAGNAVWLARGLTSDFDFYQFFLRTPDTDVLRYLHALTLLSPQWIHHQVMTKHSPDDKWFAQKLLAHHITSLIRGKPAAEKARLLSDILFPPPSQSQMDLEQSVKIALANLDLETLTHTDPDAKMEKERDSVLVHLHSSQVVGQDLTSVVVLAGLVKSRAEAKRLLAAGGLYLNNRQVRASTNASVSNARETGVVVTEHDLVQGLCLLRAGKATVKLLHVANSS